MACSNRLARSFSRDRLLPLAFSWEAKTFLLKPWPAPSRWLLWPFCSRFLPSPSSTWAAPC
jgi:hypothetical protein